MNGTVIPFVCFFAVRIIFRSKIAWPILNWRGAVNTITKTENLVQLFSGRNTPYFYSHFSSCLILNFKRTILPLFEDESFFPWVYPILRQKFFATGPAEVCHRQY